MSLRSRNTPLAAWSWSEKIHFFKKWNVLSNSTLNRTMESIKKVRKNTHELIWLKTLRITRSSRSHVCYKKLSWKISKVYRKTACWSLIFKSCRLYASNKLFFTEAIIKITSWWLLLNIILELYFIKMQIETKDIVNWTNFGFHYLLGVIRIFNPVQLCCFSIPLKTSENLKVFWRFQGV